MTTLADVIRANEKIAQLREEQQTQQTLREKQRLKKERTTKIKNALNAFFEEAKSTIEKQAKEGFQLHQIKVLFDLDKYDLDTQDVADELELHTIKHPNEMGNFFTQEIDRSDYLEEFMDVYEWSHDQGLEVYWSFEEDPSAAKKGLTHPCGSYTLCVGFFE